MRAEILVRNLGVRFDLDRQRRPVSPGMRRLRGGRSTVWALRGLELTVSGGSGLAVVGENGAGKSTLLRALAGVLPADEGAVAVRGRIGSLLSIDGGVMPALTGRENAMLVGALAGLRKAWLLEQLETVQQSSGLGDAFDRPVSTYSQGMRARLGFAVIELTEPDVLLLDEVHEAVDEPFRRRIEEQATRIRGRGGIIVAAGHDHAQLRRLSDRILIMARSGEHTCGELGRLDESALRIAS